ncbi:MAG: protein kinase [Elusimicrobia bacterium]|nr:protein kinase [Elusimicrobiota bacterium]
MGLGELPLPLTVGLGIAAVLVLITLIWQALSSSVRSRKVRFGSIIDFGPPPKEPKPGTVVGGRYILGPALDKGNASALYEARDLSDQNRLVRRTRGEHFERIKAGAALRHPNIQAVESAVSEAGHAYLVYEPASGHPLSKFLDGLPSRRMPMDQCLQVLKGACEAVDYAHSKNVFHGHLCPPYIIIDRSQSRIKDFGIPPEPFEQDYLAPEQELGAVGADSDLFGLGACLYEMLTGEPPYQGASIEAKREGQFSPASSKVKGLPAAVDAILAQALNPEPAKRFRSAAELFQSFAKAAGK